jgi:serine/threonine-protein kinase SRPK3
LGIFPKSFSRRCSKYSKYFSTNGKLKRVPNLQQWQIRDFLIAKYGYVEEEAKKLEEFMRPMLNCLP